MADFWNQYYKIIIVGITFSIIYLVYRPSLDFTRNGSLLLWYNNGKRREFFKIWE